MLETYLILLATKLYSMTNLPNKYDTPIDTTVAKNAVTNVTNPIIDWSFLLIPVGALLAGAIIGVKAFFFEDEEEREQKPIIKRLKKVLIAAVVIYLFPIFLRVFRIA